MNLVVFFRDSLNFIGGVAKWYFATLFRSKRITPKMRPFSPKKVTFFILQQVAGRILPQAKLYELGCLAFKGAQDPGQRMT